ncbi:MAG TPA: nickel-dependent lactate racemase [Bacillota bacterium]|nr:nickel-dependent lactate racemase [Bacillota bacterium]
MSIQLKTGRSAVDLDTSNLCNPLVLTGKQPPKLSDPRAAVVRAMAHPIGSMTLSEEIRRKRAKRAVIVVNDVTRPTPNNIILPPILEEIADAGIAKPDVTLVVATGIHRGITRDEMEETLGSEIVREYRVVNHDCDDESNLVYMGRLSHGTEFYVNRIVCEAEMLITTGVIGVHYFAGFSGGRKSIFPGVSGRVSIEHNHSLMTCDNATVAALDGNPVSEEMVEAGRKVDVGFTVNVVVDAAGSVCAVVAGDMEQAWLDGVRQCREISVTPIDHLFDVAIASSGGYPKDINVYQAQKGLDNAQRAVTPGGTIVLIADCTEGFGEPTFERWMVESSSLDDIFARFAERFELGGHKAYSLARVLREKEVILVSGLPDSTVRQLFMTPAHSTDEALRLVTDKHGAAFSCVVMPNSGGVVPYLEN